MVSFLFVSIGVVLLYAGGELLVRGATAMARALGVTPLVIGLTVVAFATSSPELFAALVAAFKHNPDIALGTVVGSNIANVGLILSVTALIYPLLAQKQFIQREVPFMIFSGALLFPACYDNRITRVEGLIGLILLGVFLLYLVRKSRETHEHLPIEDEIKQTPPSMLYAFVGISLGIGLLIYGAHLLVEGSVILARALGVPEKVIGLTLVAFGTSLPEAASSIVAAFKKESDLVLGNIIGSNIFNTLCILGATTAIYPIDVAWNNIFIDLCVMIAITFVVLPFLISKKTLGRKEGMVLLIGYLGYVYFLFSA